VPVFVDLLPDGFVLDPAVVAPPRWASDAGDPAGPPVRRARADGGAGADGGAARPGADRRRRPGVRRPLRCGLPRLPDARRLRRRPARAAAGALSDAAAFSFYPTKNLGAMGDGGLLTTDDDAVAATARRLRNHGSVRRYHHLEVGYNSRLDALQAAILRVKLPWLDAWTAARQRLAARYDALLAGLEGVTTPAASPGPRLPPVHAASPGRSSRCRRGRHCGPLG
jgi:hypothetical protein